jgi:hypothetical protein
MKPSIRLSVALLLAGVLTGTAWADPYWHHPRTSVEFGIQVGPPWGYPYPVYPHPMYWPPVYSGVPVIVASPPPPPVYVERPQAQPDVPVLEPGYWYYCQEAKAYYPQVKQCSGNWQKVSPQPAK